MRRETVPLPRSPVLRVVPLVIGALWWCLLLGCIAEVEPSQPQVVTAKLVTLLSDPSPEMRKTAAVALGKIGRSEATRPLIERLGDQNGRVREASAWALGNLRETEIHEVGVPLSKLLTDPSDAVRRAAARSLASLGATQVTVELIGEALRDANPESRRAAAQALFGIEAKAAYPDLVRALGDRDSRVRQGALAALGELADSRGLPLFRSLLKRDEAEGVRVEAAYRLGKLGGFRELTALRSSAEGDSSPSVRAWAHWAMRQLTPHGGND